MNETINYDSLLILSVVAFFTPFLVSRLKRVNIPYQVGEIFIGILLGKSFLNIIKPDIWILFLSNLGLAYLMFLSGLAIDFDELKPKEGELLKVYNNSYNFIIYIKICRYFRRLSILCTTIYGCCPRITCTYFKNKTHNK